jgi:ankyrin repeat protein
MNELLSTTPNFAEKHPQLSRDLGLARRLTNNTPEPRDASGETQDGNTQDDAGSTAKGEIPPYTGTSFEHVDIDCELLSSAPRPHPAYTTLGHDCIRLLKILPASSTAEIRCQLDEFILHESPAYTALSYTWGSQHGIHQIYVNDYPLLVPKNLWRFLNHARDLAKDLSGYIWCDMLSINQVDLAERGHQVKLMSGIFKTARTVVVWLGPAYRGSDTAMTALSRLPHGKGFAKQASQLWAGNAGHAMDGICSRNYWRRLWVFQEIWLAQNIRLMCGSKTAPWSHFHALMEYAHARSGTSQLDDNTEAVAKSPAMRMMNLNIESVDTVLWSLVQGTRHLRCFDARDKIYALLGVATKGHESIEPDYSMPVPSLLNRLLHEIWSESPPETFEEAAEWCAKIENVFGLKSGTIFSMQGQRGRYSAPSNAEMRSCRLGPKSSDFTLWWTAFYGHSSVQTLLRNSWTISCFDGDLSEQSGAMRDASFTSTPVVSLIQFLREDMDNQSSFLSLEDPHAELKTEELETRSNFAGLGAIYAGLDAMEPKANRNMSFLEGFYVRRQNTAPEEPETNDAEALGSSTCMAWVAFYLTDAIDRNDSHVTRLLLDVGQSFGLLYTQYRPIATLIEATAGALRSAIGSKDVFTLETIFVRSGPFISDTNRFVTEMLDHGMTLGNCGLLLELGLLDMVQPHQRAALLDMALSRALSNKNDEAVEALLGTGECDPNCLVSGDPALYHCMYSSQESNFRALLDTGKCDLSAADPSSGLTPLMQAVQLGLHPYVRAIVGTGACQLDDANALSGMTPVLYAALHGHTDTMGILLNDGWCNVDMPHGSGTTALMMAVEGSHESTAALILEFSQGDLNATDDSGNTALGSASAKGLSKVVRRLLESSACDVNFKNLQNYTPLMLAAMREQVAVVGELLSCDRCDVNASDDDGDTALSIAVETKNAKLVREFLACERCDLNHSGKFGRTALITAIRGRNLRLASEILACKRCNPNISDSSGRTPLMLAAEYSDYDPYTRSHPILEALLNSKGCDINAETDDGWTALMFASRNSNIVVERLLRTGMCSIDQPLQNLNSTILHMAAKLDDPYFLAQFLTQWDLNLSVHDHVGYTPLIIAVIHQRRDNVEALIGYKGGCDVNVRSRGNYTALSYAVRSGDYDTVCLLVNSGRVEDMDEPTGESLISVAREQGNTAIERVLTELAEKLQTRKESDSTDDGHGSR